MQTLQSYLDRMGNNFLTASMIPSLGFVTFAMVIFQPIIPDAILSRLGGTFYPISQSGFVALLITIILGFSLTSLNTYVYKIFEGYVILHRFSLFARQKADRPYEYTVNGQRNHAADHE